MLAYPPVSILQCLSIALKISHPYRRYFSSPVSRYARNSDSTVSGRKMYRASYGGGAPGLTYEYRQYLASGIRRKSDQHKNNGARYALRALDVPVLRHVRDREVEVVARDAEVDDLG